jgi:hypothetical protein
MADKQLIVFLCVTILAILSPALLAMLVTTPSRRITYVDKFFKTCLALTAMSIGVFFKMLLFP